MRLRAYTLSLIFPFLSNPSYESESIHADISLVEQIPVLLSAQSLPSPKPISTYTTAGLLEIVASTRNCQDFTGASKELVQRMKKEQQKELFLGLHSHVYTLDEEKDFTLEDYISRSFSPFVVEKSSPYLSPLLEDISSDLKQDFSSSDIYFVFTPSLLNCAFSKPLQNILGMTYDYGLIFVKNSSEVKHSLFSSIIAHEIQHTQDRGKTLLEKESNATRREIETLYSQKRVRKKSCKEDPTKSSCSVLQDYEERLDFLTKRLKTIEYLSMKKFKQAFVQVYPSERIMSASLLEANVSQEVLLPYTQNFFTGNKEKDKELQDAAKIALLVLQTPEAQRLQTLQTIIDSPDVEESQKINVHMAIAFCSPPPKESENPAWEYPDPNDGNTLYKLSEEKTHNHPIPMDLFSEYTME